MRLSLHVDLDNAAFRLDNGQLAVEAIADALRDVAERVGRNVIAGPIVDVNGNKVGRFTISREA